MALSANTTYELRNVQAAFYGTRVIATSSVIYQHAMVVEDVSSGLAVPAGNNATTKFLGLAVESSSGSFPITGNAAGSATVTFMTNVEARMTLKTAVTAGATLGPAYAFDDADITFFTTRGAEVGSISERVAANDGWVWLGHKNLRAGAA